MLQEVKEAIQYLQTLPQKAVEEVVVKVQAL
jgi:hypothetical protein